MKDFHKEVVVASRRQIVVVDCYTDWCGPCKIILPKLVELQAFFDENHARPDEETGDTRAVRIVKLNCNDENKSIAKDKLKIKAAPTFKVSRAHETRTYSKNTHTHACWQSRIAYAEGEQ